MSKNVAAPSIDVDLLDDTANQNQSNLKTPNFRAGTATHTTDKKKKMRKGTIFNKEADNDDVDLEDLKLSINPKPGEEKEGTLENSRGT